MYRDGISCPHMLPDGPGRSCAVRVESRFRQVEHSAEVVPRHAAIEEQTTWLRVSLAEPAGEELPQLLRANDLLGQITPALRQIHLHPAVQHAKHAMAYGQATTATSTRPRVHLRLDVRIVLALRSKLLE